MAGSQSPFELSLAEAAPLLRDRALSPVELTSAVLEQIRQVDDRTHAYVTVLGEAALDAARTAEAEIAAGKYRGPLHGVPIALKDIIDLRGVPTTANSRVRAGHVAARDSAVVERLRAAGAIFTGKTVTHEWAYGTVSPPTRNPWNLDHIPGGSSGGSAAAVAAGECLAAIGSDSGGSIRIPAAFNGTVGLKPTYGRVSKRGVLPLAWSLDHLGPLTKRVADAALVLQAIAGHDPYDPATVDLPVPDYSAGLEAGVRCLRCGIIRNYFWDEIDPEVAGAVETAAGVLRSAGATVTDVTIPIIEFAMRIGRIIVRSESSAYHLPLLRRQAEDYGPLTRLVLEAGALLPATAYLKAQRARVLIKRGFREAFRDYDVLLAPTTPAPAPPAALWAEGADPAVGAAVIDTFVRAAYPGNLSGLPALSVPCGFTSAGLPAGLQIIGRPFDEATVLRVGRAYEAATDWHTRCPGLVNAAS